MSARLIGSAVLIHPPCGCGLAPVHGWTVDGYGLVECLLCTAVWTEILPCDGRETHETYMVGHSGGFVCRRCGRRWGRPL